MLKYIILIALGISVTAHSMNKSLSNRELRKLGLKESLQVKDNNKTLYYLATTDGLPHSDVLDDIEQFNSIYGSVSDEGVRAALNDARDNLIYFCLERSFPTVKPKDPEQERQLLLQQQQEYRQTKAAKQLLKQQELQQRLMQEQQNRLICEEKHAQRASARENGTFIAISPLKKSNEENFKPLIIKKKGNQYIHADVWNKQQNVLLHVRAQQHVQSLKLENNREE